MKICAECGLSKGDEEFYRHTTGTLYTRCKVCQRAIHAKRYRDAKAVDPVGVHRIHRDRGLRHRYGIDIDAYESLLEQQGGVCAICDSPPGKRPLDVDHDHDTGVVRGLLCPRCNTALGTAEQPGWLDRTTRYLEISRVH